MRNRRSSCAMRAVFAAARRISGGNLGSCEIFVRTSRGTIQHVHMTMLPNCACTPLRRNETLLPRGFFDKCASPHSRGGESFTLESESDFQRHLIMVHAAIADLSANLHNLEPAQMPQCLGRIGDGGVH